MHQHQGSDDDAPRNCSICCKPDLKNRDIGVGHARKDGRRLDCKSCIRKKVTNSRRALKEYRSERKRYIGQPLTDREATLLGDGETTPENYPRILSKLSPVDRVREAI